MMFHRLMIVLLAGGVSATALAQPFPSTDTGAGDASAVNQSIVILGRGLALPPGTPAYGSVTIDRAQLQNEASGSVEGALTDVAGFQEFRRSDSRSANPSAQGVTLRALGGNATSRALFLLDGVPQADPFFGSVPFTALDPQEIGAARVTRGGGAGAFGAGAVAGTVELFSADRAQQPQFMASGFYGSRNAQQLSAAYSPDVGAGFVSVYGQFDRGDGFYTTPEDERVSASVPARYRNWSVGLRGVAPVGAQGEIQARVNLFRDNRTLRFAGADSAIQGDDASLRYISRGRWQVDALGYVQLRNFQNITISSTRFTPVLDQRNTPATGVGGKLELRPPVGGNHVLRIGIDSRYADANMYEHSISAFTGDVTERREAQGQEATSGLFVEDNWTLGSVVLTGSVRGDRWTISNGSTTAMTPDGMVTSNSRYPDRSDWELSLRGGALWHVNDAVALRAAGYSSFRLPTINELYRGFTVFPVVTQANAALAPERLKGGELGIELTPARGISLSATAFYNRLDNAIANVTIATNVRQRRNVDAIVAKGIELNAHVDLGAFDLAASYAYNDSHVEASGAASALNGLWPAQSARNMASATLGWTGQSGTGLAGLRVATTLRYIGPQYEDDLEANRMPGVLTVDGVARVPLAGRLDLIGRVENLMDATVITRKVDDDIDLGTPRTFWIGFSITG